LGRKVSDHFACNNPEVEKATLFSEIYAKRPSQNQASVSSPEPLVTSKDARKYQAVETSGFVGVLSTLIPRQWHAKKVGYP
jgi:hypothetical protein